MSEHCHICGQPVAAHEGTSLNQWSHGVVGTVHSAEDEIGYRVADDHQATGLLAGCIRALAARVVALETR